MQIKVNKLQKIINGDVSGNEAIVIFLEKGNIVHEERFTGKIDSVYKRDVKWEGVYDKHQDVLLNGGEFEYELILEDEHKNKGALASIVDMLHLSSNDLKEGRTVSSEELKSNLKNRSTKKNADK